MFNHVSIGVKDTDRSKSFYDAALKPLGFKCAYEAEGSLGYGTKEGIGLWIGAVKKPVPADTGSNLHFCFDAPSRKAVDAFYDAAIKAGGKDNGKPGLRTDYSPTYYAAFVVDPDGYRIEAVYSK
jgi:catechol 2,3-dioxygenase-like lactoylglutathione lyase family enzyme